MSQETVVRSQKKEKDAVKSFGVLNPASGILHPRNEAPNK